MEFRGVDLGGFIAGTPESRQVQILKSDRAAIWAVAVGTRNLEDAHARLHVHAKFRAQISTSPNGARAARGLLFAEVGGVLFEILRIEK